MAKITITCGAGFIGSHLVDALHEQGHTLTVLDNMAGGRQNIQFIKDKCTLIEGDVTDREAVKKAVDGADRIYHLAAHAAEGQSIYIPIFNAHSNLMGSVTVLTEAIAAGVNEFVFASSIAAYGHSEHVPITETEPLLPEDPYGVTKASFERYLHIYHKLGYINPYIFRFYNVFGPRQRMDDPYRGVVPIFFNKCLKGEKPVIFGDGLQERAFTYITDIIGPLVDYVGNEQLINNPLNIGSSEVWSVRRLAKEIMKVCGVAGEPDYIDARKSDVKVAYCDTTKAQELMGYEAKVSVSCGLKKTADWAMREGVKDFRYTDYRELPKLEHSAYVKKTI